MIAAHGEPVVSLEGVCRSFDRGRTLPTVDALVDVSLAVAPNEILGIVGANGAGKTTLLDILATTVIPTRGTARICGLDVRRDAGAVRCRIGYVPSGARAFYPRLSVRRNLTFFAALYGLTGAVAQSRIAAVLRMVNAEDVAPVRADRVSDGMLGRAALARALLHEPTVLLLDEPTRSIDPAQRSVMLHAIRTFVNGPGKAALLVTHAVEDVHETCDRVAVLRGGRIESIIPVTRARSRAPIGSALPDEASV